MIVAVVLLVAFTSGSPDADNIKLNAATNDNFQTNYDDKGTSTNTVHTNKNENVTVSEQDNSANNQELDIDEDEPDNSQEATGRVIDPNKPMVALTFDDGPSPKYTEKLLEVLAEYNSVATFFEVGQNAERYPEIIKKEIEAGCELGNHSYSHANLVNISEAEAVKEIEDTNNIFIEITGSPATLIRPPYGSIKERASLFDQPVVTWSVDTLDWQSRDADSVMQKIYDEDTLDGKVILMHSLYESSYEATCRLVPYLIENGYQLVTVSELYEYKHGEKMNNGELYNYTYFQ